MSAIVKFALLSTALAVMGFVYWILMKRPPVFFGANEAPVVATWWLIPYGYFVTLFGVACSSGCREIIARRSQGESAIPDLTKFGSDILHSTELWLGIFGSPLVFAFTLKGFDGHSTAGFTILALENGFTCTMLVATFLANPESKKKPASKTKADSQTKPDSQTPSASDQVSPPTP